MISNVLHSLLLFICLINYCNTKPKTSQHSNQESHVGRSSPEEVQSLDKPKTFRATISFWKSLLVFPLFPATTAEVGFPGESLWDVLASQVGNLAKKTTCMFIAARWRQWSFSGTATWTVSSPFSHLELMSSEPASSSSCSSSETHKILIICSLGLHVHDQSYWHQKPGHDAVTVVPVRKQCHHEAKQETTCPAITWILYTAN